MGMRLRDANEASESSFCQLAIVNAIHDVGEQLDLRLAEGHVGVSWYFKLK
jgi:hypothetical protein